MKKRLISLFSLVLILCTFIVPLRVKANEGEDSSFRVYFYNYENWNQVYFYLWEKKPDGSEGDVDVPWPGELATQDETESDWWYIEGDKLEIGMHVIFHSMGQRPQAKDLVISRLEDTYVSVFYEKVDKDYLLVEYDSREEVLEAAKEWKQVDPNTKTTIWFYNSDGWEKVYIYAYNGTFEFEPTGSWPGSLAKRDGKTHWYFYEVRTALPVHIIFNNGSARSEENKDFMAEAYVTEGVYVTIGKNKTYSSKAEAEATIAEVKPIPEPQEEIIENRFVENTSEAEYIYKDPNDLIIGITLYVITGILGIVAIASAVLLLKFLNDRKALNRLE